MYELAPLLSGADGHLISAEVISLEILIIIITLPLLVVVISPGFTATD